MKVIVIGDSCIDYFIYGSAERLNPEAPTPVFVSDNTIEYDGMAGNVFNNVISLSSGYDIKLITNEDKITKTRYVDKKSNYTLLRVDNDIKIRRITEEEIKSVSDYDLTIISDYNKGFLTESDITDIINNSKLVFIDTKKMIGGFLNDCDFLKINKEEFFNNLNNGEMSLELSKKTIVTLGPRGATLDGKTFKTDKVSVSDVAGAGDTFLASLSLKYLKTKNIEESIKFANKCSSEVVSKTGITLPKITLE